MYTFPLEVCVWRAADVIQLVEPFLAWYKQNSDPW